MQKLKVLKISHTAAVASYRARERALVSEFPVELEVVTPEFWPHLGLEHSNDADEDFVVHRVATLGSGNVPLFAFAPGPLKRIIKQFQPDIIDIHEEPYSVSGFEAVALARRFAPQAALLYYTAQNINKNYPPPFCWTEQYVYSSCAAAYPCSSQAAEILTNKGFEGLISIMPLGIDPEQFNCNVLSAESRAQRRDSLTLRGFVIGCFGRVESYKGIQYVFEAVSKIPASLECSIAIVGNGSYRKALKNLAKDLGISARVHWLGEKKAGEIPEWMALCDCIVIPSLTTATWKEQFGRIAVESMACGVPVIVSDSGSLPEVVGQAGLITPEANSQKLKDCIVQLKTDTRMRQDLIEAGLALVEEKYLWSRVAQQTFDLYKQIANCGARLIVLEH
jgi:glycosyltransferase involved in cell wall biosynthesis